MLELPEPKLSFKKTDKDTDLQVADVELSFKKADQDAAWELYVEMLTRITTQALPAEVGDEKTALDSVYSLFRTTRKILRQRGRKTIEFSKVCHTCAKSGCTSIYRKVA